MAAGGSHSETKHQAQHGQSQPALRELPCRHPQLLPVRPAGELWARSTAALLVKPSRSFAHHTAGISITPLLPTLSDYRPKTPAIHNRHDFARAERAGRRARTGQRTIPSRPPLARCFAVNASLPLYTAYPPPPSSLSPSAIHNR